MAQNTEEQPAGKTRPDPKSAAQDDVLVLVKRGGPYRPTYNRPADPRSLIAEKTGKGAVEAVVLQVPPGLGTIPAKHWPHIKAQSRFQAHVKGGRVVVVAGDEGSLAQGWARVAPSDALAWLDKTGDVATLEMLRDIEGKATRPRHEVAEAIDDALRRVAKQRAKLQQARQTQRQQHRRAAW